jgi:hypothetical protein
MKTPFLTAGLLLSMLATGLCQPANPLENVPPPTAPFVANLPAKARWSTVGVTQPSPASSTDQPASQAAQGLKIDSTLWNAVKTDVLIRPGRETETLVYYAGFVLVDGRTTSGEKASVLVQQLPGTNYSNFRSPGWMGTEWISEEHYVEPQVYRRQLPAGPNDAAEEITYHYTREASPDWEKEYIPAINAWIRVKDQIPVAVSIDGALFEFQMQPPPSEPPLMTARQSQKLMELKDQNDRMLRLQQRSTASPN